MLKQRFQLVCLLEPDNPLEFEGMTEDAQRRVLAERLQQVLDRSAARSLIACGVRAVVNVLRVHDETTQGQRLRKALKEAIGNNDDIEVDDDAPVSMAGVDDSDHGRQGFVSVWHWIRRKGCVRCGSQCDDFDCQVCYETVPCKKCAPDNHGHLGEEIYAK